MKKIFTAVLVLCLLAGCRGNVPEAGESVSETVSTAAEVLDSAFTTVTTFSTVVFEEAETTTEAAGNVYVTPADEVYDVYPKRIIYPEKTETNITAEKAEINEELKKDGCTVYEFTAVYPVFGGGDAAVMQKINDGVKSYIDSVHEEISRRVEEFDLDKDGYMIIPPWHFSMTIRALGSGGWENGIDLDYDINGNILSVDFYTEDHAPLAAHGAVIPVSLVFDLRTGERVIFNDIFEDKEAVANEINMAAYQYFENRWRSGGVEGYESGFEEFAESPDYYDLDRDRVTVKNGCLSYCTVPYEFGGSFADGMELMDVAVEDIYPYLNEAGRSLFEGFVSAKSEPVNIIEENGEKYFDFEKADD